MNTKKYANGNSNTAKAIVWLLTHVKSSWKSYITAILFTSFQNLIFGYIVAKYIKDVFDIILSKKTGSIGLPMVLFVSILVGSSTLYFVGRMLMLRAVNNISHKIRCSLFDHLEKLPSSFYDKYHSGEISSYLLNDLQQMNSLYSNNIVNVISQLATIIGSFAIVFSWEWRLGIVYAVFAGSSFIYSRNLLKKVKTYTQNSLSSMADLNQKLIDILAGMRELRIFSLKKILLARFDKANSDNRMWRTKEIEANAWLKGMNMLYLTASFVGIITVGFVLVGMGITTVGTVIGSAMFIQGYIWMYRAIITEISGLISSLAAGERLMKLVCQPLETEEKQSYDKVHIMREKSYHSDKSVLLDVNNISFGYNKESIVLDNIALKIDSGMVLGIAGANGAGKSTLMKIIAGLYVPCSGEMCLNGADYHSVSIDQWRKSISYLPQNTFLFMGTIYDNISIVKPTATYEEVIKAAKAAFADDFIRSLPKGYDTVAGSGGKLFSTGERQKIAIARAFLKDSPLLLLDEPTASLDTQSEFLIERALKNLMAGRTTLVTAHRLPTMNIADKVIVLNGGKIEESGSPTDLLGMDSLYGKLYKSQVV